MHRSMSEIRLILVERNEHSSVNVTLRSVSELEEYLESSMRRSLLGEILIGSDVAGYILER